MRFYVRCLLVILVSLFINKQNVSAQKAPTEDTLEENDLSNDRSRAPRLFLDCGACDFSYTRQEITFVNYVRDPELADVHVFVTSQRTGSGGEIFTLTFTGQDKYAGLINSLTYTGQQNETGDERRRGLTEVLKIGLVPYVARTPLINKLRVSFEQSLEIEPAPVNDPWNSWVFDVEGSGSFNAEASNENYALNSSFSAGRVTADFKIGANLYGNFRERIFENEDETIRSTSHSSGLSGHWIKSLSNHWSAGVFSNVSTNTYRNLGMGLGITPALEFNIYPYSESSRKELSLSYRFGYGFRKYIEETIYEKNQESLLNQSLHANIRIRQPWGFIFAGMSGSLYFHDLTKNSIDFYSNLSFRLSKGLSLRLSGNFEIIHDQLYLAKGDASLEEILLQQRQLATTYEMSGSVGLAYTFGSMYNNIVNTRL